MGKRLEKLTPELIDFIGNQKLFFVATAMEDGRVNLSPKGMDALRVIDGNRVIWLNLTGSGNETAAHLQYNNRMTLMFCAFEGKPMILRLYGIAKAYHEHDPFWKAHIHRFSEIEGSRQLIDMEFDLVQISCGMGVPYMDYTADREGLKLWAKKQGKDRIIEYRKKKNSISLDGRPTGLPEA
ncbi:pyridoxamine 5'-phosphate oxidase family protein [Spongiimicrobium sp. 2-473A-2-J]|uniref:pyridoxamine 5'-phosphate oxidase family protein n=1 Tax=Eudoraea algarum TaxID=3417568 RepID=UPI003D35F34D